MIFPSCLLICKSILLIFFFISSNGCSASVAAAANVKHYRSHSSQLITKVIFVFRNFEEIYDVDVFMKSMEGLVRVVKDLPDHISSQNIAAVKVPNRVTEDYIAARVEPIYRSKGNIRLATYFPSVNMRKGGKKGDTDSVACLAMFGSLELQPEIHELIESMVERLRALSSDSDGRFVAVDLRVDMLDGKSCQGIDDERDKSCFSAHEIAVFLRKIGFDKDTTVYVTESKWDSSLDSLKDLFPKTYTKVRHFKLTL